MKALENFDSKTNGDVIIYCGYNNRPVEHNISFHCIVPDLALTKDEKNNVKILINLATNPNFNRFENIKYYRLDDERLKCLKNKTVHIQLPASTSLLENILIFVYNTEGFSTKIINYNYRNSDHYLYDFLDYSGSEGQLGMVLGYANVTKKRFEHFPQRTDDVYLIQSFDSVEILGFCRLHLQGRKGFVYYGSVCEIARMNAGINLNDRL